MEVLSPFRLPRKTPFGLGENFAEWVIGLSKLDQYYSQKPAKCDCREFLRFTLDILGIDYRVIKGSLTHIPKSGATVVVANHPLGCVEGVILAELLLHVRSDVQILANQYLKTVPELDQLFIGVDVFEGQNAHKANLKALRQAHSHLDKGGLLLLFPAGEVSQLVDPKSQRIEDKEWSRSVSSLVRKAKANTIPVFIDGQNSKRFYLAGKVHPLLRTLMLGRELLNKSQQPINISIGSAIRYKEINGLTDEQIVNYLRLNTYLLQNKTLTKTDAKALESQPLPISDALPVRELKIDLNALPREHHLLTSGEFEVYCTDADYIPSILHEIGRLREINFRKVGEGTGLALDIDEFDRHYKHLFIWDKDNERLVGAYRLGLVDELMLHEGLAGLYSRTLFHYGKDFLNTMGSSIEMGRSVIDEHYQKSMGALLLLWKGIATFVHRNPSYTHLFGPVSISNDYSEQARQLLAQTMTLHHYDSEKAEYVTPSNPLPTQHTSWNTSMLTALADLQLLSRVIARIDDGKGVPVLLRQYLGLNGKLISFNVDPSFNNALDGLIVVDLKQVPLKTLTRCMGATQAQQYLQHHNSLPN
ncbi:MULTISPECIES: lysophospholipid acyltransferase family protein [Vibrio]|uniref:lysophospholipid acyltransferase family protein n=1 Tax=Vibrio TaxID=662 RepID=UPI00207618B5|nr:MULTISPECIES: GNAT family N-acyltransferase [Vibrio]USD32176.1 lysophospholipid acyltransferase family protein [Vibrio sp. SCSIO 43186]USD45219.1 lysophospholipid acyltransferase family protein [Vibrio sp. SCSIO 43145]USD69302.1 lysophospholipid acyltransferase family protein [Vibrio sp. SCSIO 43139]USD96989.1 hemolysin [Vibrio coralliilyticus]